MISDRMLKTMNEQIAKEFYSGYMYLEMAAYFEEAGLEGMASWMRIQAQEEECHAMIFFNYVNEQGGRVRLGGVDEPPHEYDSPLDVFEKGLEHEKKVTASINNLVDIAIEEKDHASRSFLNWFVDEQVEEEDGFNRVASKLKLVKADSNALFMIDKELGARVFNIPAPLAGKI